MTRSFVGRTAERRRFHEAWAAVTASGEARCVEIIGEPGIGKSTLIELLCVEVAQQGHRVLRGGLSEAESELSWAGLATLVGDLVEAGAPGISAAALVPLQAALGLAPAATTDAGAVAFALSTFVRELAGQQPLLVAIDDTHWLDRPTAAAVTFALRVRGPVLFLLARRRDEESSIDAARAMPPERMDVLELGGLTVAGIHEMVDSISDRRPGRHDLVRLHELTGGNPLFVDRLSRLLADGASLDAIDLPRDLDRALGAQLRGIDPATLQLAGVVALAGRAPVDLIAKVCGPGHEASMAEAVRRRLVLERAGVTEMTHPLLREIVTTMLPLGERRRLHRALAEHVADVEARARHMADGADGPDAVVADALAEAATVAIARGAPGSAVELLVRSAEATPRDRPAERWERGARAGSAALAAGQWRRAKDLLDAAYQAAPDIEARRAIVWERIVAAHRIGPMETTITLIRTVIDEVGDDPRLRARLLRGLAQVLLFENLPRAIEVAREAVAGAETTGDRMQLIFSQVILLKLCSFAPQPLDVSPLLAALATIEAGADRDFVEEHLADLLRYAGDDEGSLEMSRRELARARTSGETTLLINALSGCSSALELLGELHEALAFTDEIIELPASFDSPQDLADGLCQQLRLRAILGGEIAELVGQLDAMRELCPRSVRFQQQAEIGMAYTHRGDHALAEPRLDEAARLAREWGYDAMRVLPIAHGLVECRVRLGQIDRAEPVARWAEATAAAEDCDHSRALAARCSGLVAAARGDREAAALHFERALQAHATSGDPFETAGTLTEYGVVLRGLRRRRDSRAALEQALAAFVRMGAVYDERRARDELARLGATPVASANELTPTEQRIAEMAAGGSTNAEIAAALYINARTVESNLTKVYRKLGVRSRTELAAMAGSLGR